MAWPCGLSDMASALVDSMLLFPRGEATRPQSVVPDPRVLDEASFFALVNVDQLAFNVTAGDVVARRARAEDVDDEALALLVPQRLVDGARVLHVLDSCYFTTQPVLKRTDQ